MTRDRSYRPKTSLLLIAGLTFIAGTGIALAQSVPDTPVPAPEPPQQAEPQQTQPPAPPAAGGWRRASERTPAAAVPAGPLDQYGGPANGQYGPPPQGQGQGQGQWGPPQGMPQQAPPPLPATLTIKPGTFVTVRVDHPLSSDHNQAGDAFSATLVRPLVVDGVVVAERGQTLAGQVVEAQKAGRISGTSRLGVQLTDLTLADGQQFPLKTQLVNREGTTTVGRDAGAVAGTTATGAAIGAAADWGRGAAIGAGAGAVAGIVGVLLTRGRETVIFPEMVLTFRIEAPITFSTERGAQAFRWVEREDYDRPTQLQTRQQPMRAGCGPYGCPPPSLYGNPYYYAGPYYPYYGPSFGFYYGPRYNWGPGFSYGRGYYRGHRR
jgi:hypothetical protein